MFREIMIWCLLEWINGGLSGASVAKYKNLFRIVHIIFSFEIIQNNPRVRIIAREDFEVYMEDMSVSRQSGENSCLVVKFMKWLSVEFFNLRIKSLNHRLLYLVKLWLK
jgi:hypothetical protein